MDGIVGDELGQPHPYGRQFGRSVLKLGLKIGPQRREIAALRALGAAQLQLCQRQLVFDFDAVEDPSRVLPRLVHQMDRAGADHGQHKKARRQQQDLADHASARGVRPHKFHGRAELKDPPAGNPPMPANAGHGRRVPGDWNFFGVVQPVGGWPARYCSSQWIW